MKMKRALSFLLVLTMLLSLCVPVASAAGTDYKAGITVSKVDDAKLSVSVDVGPSGASTKIQGVQSFVLAFDMSVLKAVLKNGNAFAGDCPDGTYRVYSPEGEFLALCKAETGTVKTIKSFFEV